MRIGISASTFAADSYGRYGANTYQKLKEHGYECTDLDLSNTESRLYTATHAEALHTLTREKELAQAAGIEITQVHGPWRWPARDFTREDRDERMAKMKQSLRLTSILGCHNWVIHPIMPYGVEDLKTGEADKTWAMNLAFMSELLQTAKQYDITICLENMPMLHFSLSQPADILRFVQAVNDDHFQICLDTGHCSVFHLLDLAAETRRLGDAIRVLHVHDNRHAMDLHLTPLEGVIQWSDFAQALKDIHFTGSFSLETCAPLSALPDDLFEAQSKLLAGIARYIIGE